MKIVSLFFIGCMFFTTQLAHAQDFRVKLPDTTVFFSKANVDQFWKDHQPVGSNYVGVFIDGGEAVGNACSVALVLKADVSSSPLSTYVKPIVNQYQIKFEDYGKFGKENLLLTSMCGLRNLSTEDFLESNAWMIFKLNKHFKKLITDEDREKNPDLLEKKYKKVTCFQSSNGISVDIPSNNEIFLFLYTYSKYDLEAKSVEYGRKLPYPYCDNLAEFKD